MAKHIKNVNPDIPECDEQNMGIISERITVPDFDLGLITTGVYDFEATVSGIANSKIQNIMRATTFPIADILQMMEDHPGCKHVRVYNAFDPGGKYLTYMAALDKDFKTYSNPTSSSSCCHCRPCRLDKILNP